ncbi:hypothetical protein L7H23_01710 [Sphingopyxis sp. BSN-002]|uniref:hypothetical protein n=1 Tax=Sphingopyxis sp. BSN-002 TaxID=2911495 RepID=UPI001EDA533C|nr:hypothetical protein [Sphingopyxis sp. BSN-002]UKK84847.1 hypothetical protein L7H23_01710 [Sphingopyxis sp. BSN-002]
MRPMFWVTFALMTAAGLTAVPAHAQFAAEDAAELPTDADGAYDEAAYDQGDAAADPYAEPAAVDPYATDPAYTPSQSIGDRSVADLATSVLGAKGARRVQDAETVVRTVIGKAGTRGETPGPANADPIGLVRDILTAAGKTRDPQ